MNGAWRYTTINCQRVYRWYERVGQAERVTALAANCTRAVGVVLPLLPALPMLNQVPVGAPALLPAGAGPDAASLAALPAEAIRYVPAAVEGPASYLAPFPPGDIPRVELPRADGPQDVVEPASVALLGLGLVLIGVARVRRHEFTSASYEADIEIPTGAARPPVGAATAGQGA